MIRPGSVTQLSAHSLPGRVGVWDDWVGVGLGGVGVTFGAKTPIKRCSPPTPMLGRHFKSEATVKSQLQFFWPISTHSSHNLSRVTCLKKTTQKMEK